MYVIILVAQYFTVIQINNLSRLEYPDILLLEIVWLAMHFAEKYEVSPGEHSVSKWTPPWSGCLDR